MDSAGSSFSRRDDALKFSINVIEYEGRGMTIRVECGKCFKEYRVKDSSAGKKFHCKSCGAVIEIAEADPWDTKEDLYGDEDYEDEYEEPAYQAPRKKKKRKRRNSSSLMASIGGIGLMVLGSLAILGGSLYLIVAAVNGPDPARMPKDAAGQFGYQIGFVIGLIIGALITIGVHGTILYGGWQLFQRGSRGWAKAACILSCIPLCSPFCVGGIPFGILGLIGMGQIDDEGGFEYD